MSAILGLLLAASPLHAQVSGHIYGLTLAINGGGPNTTVDVATGSATDSTNTYSIPLASAFTKAILSSVIMFVLSVDGWSQQPQAYRTRAR
jgi:hypothetical protein